MAMTAPEPISVLVVDDHALLREGVCAMVANFAGIKVAGQAGNGQEALTQYRLLRPDITLMDLQMPVMSGVDAMLAIRALNPAARIIALTTYKGDAQASRALHAGASGYLLKGSLWLDLQAAITAVHGGSTYVSPEVASEMSAYYSADALSPRESEVLNLVAKGYANKAVGKELAIKEETVKAHMSTILAKLGANDRTHAVTIAIRRGMLEL